MNTTSSQFTGCLSGFRTCWWASRFHAVGTEFFMCTWFLYPLSIQNTYLIFIDVIWEIIGLLSLYVNYMTWLLLSANQIVRFLIRSAPWGCIVLHQLYNTWPRQNWSDQNNHQAIICFLGNFTHFLTCIIVFSNISVIQNHTMICQRYE